MPNDPFFFEDMFAQSKGAVTTDLITLYKALGGGWEEMSENESAQP
jgi:outer membrane protein TolC